MLEPPAYPAWLEAHLIDDTSFERAYEDLGASGRARLKQAIAVLHVFWGEAEERRHTERVFRQGFRVREDMAPAPYTLLVCDSAYAFPSCLLAALMPAVLAGCPLILPCFAPTAGRAEASPDRCLPVDCGPGVRSPLGMSDPAAKDRPSRAKPLPVAGPLLAALELSGLERAFALTEEGALDLFGQLHDAHGRGRLVIMGRDLWGEPLLLQAGRLGIPTRAFLTPPLYLRAEGGQEILPDGREPDATAPQLELDENHESVWIWPDLSPDWFRNRRLRLTA